MSDLHEFFHPLAAASHDVSANSSDVFALFFNGIDCWLWNEMALEAIADRTTQDEIFKGLSAAFGDWNQMIFGRHHEAIVVSF